MFSFPMNIFRNLNFWGGYLLKKNLIQFFAFQYLGYRTQHSAIEVALKYHTQFDVAISENPSDEGDSLGRWSYHNLGLTMNNLFYLGCGRHALTKLLSHVRAFELKKKHPFKNINVYISKTTDLRYCQSESKYQRRN